jgi:imidazolonepropionase-like amidohydrolase
VAAPRGQAAPPPTLFAGVRVFDGTGDESSPPSDVLVEDGRVRAIGAPGELPAPAYAVRIDGAGKTLLPGLVDLHARLGLGDGAPPWADRGEDARQVAGTLLWAGVTTALVPVREADLEALNAAIRAGRVGGPRIYRSARVIAIEDGPARAYGRSLPGPEAAAVAGIDGADEAARAARWEFEHRHPSFVSISLAPDPRGRALGGDAVRAVAAEAREYGRRAIAFAPSPAAAVEAAEAGAALIVAIPWTAVFSADEAGRLAATGVPVVTAVRAPGRREAALAGRATPGPFETEALFPGRAHAFAPPRGGIPGGAAEAAAALAGADARARENVRVLREAGVPLLAGSGGGLPGLVPGAALHEELAALVAAGIPPGEALQMATSLPARFLDPIQGIGVVLPGARADLVLVEGDPAVDIAATTRIAGVWQGGRRVVRAGEGQSTKNSPTAR